MEMRCSAVSRGTRRKRQTKQTRRRPLQARFSVFYITSKTRSGESLEDGFFPRKFFKRKLVFSPPAEFKDRSVQPGETHGS